MPREYQSKSKIPKNHNLSIWSKQRAETKRPIITNAFQPDIGENTVAGKS